MKKLFLILCGLIITTSIYAQSASVKSITCFAPGHHLVSLVIDYSDVDVLGMTESEFAYVDDLWEQYKPTFYHAFNYGINTETHPGRDAKHNLTFGKIEDTEYALVVRITEVDLNGDVEAVAELRDREDNVIVSFKDIDGDSKLEDMVSEMWTPFGKFDSSYSTTVVCHAERGMYWAGRSLGEFMMDIIK